MVGTRVLQAEKHHADEVSSVLQEAANWLRDMEMPMWRADELVASRIAMDIDAGLFFKAECDGEVAGVMKFQLEDPLFWPDVPQSESAFVHRLAVRRKFAGRGVSLALLYWAVERANSLGRQYVRLDCETSRTRLREFYEGFGFRHHSNLQVGPYYVARYQLTLFSKTPGDNETQPSRPD